MGAKHQKLLVGNNAPGKCLHAHMQHFFSPSPAMEKKFAESAFFIQKSKTCHETVGFTSQWGENIKNYSWATMPQASAFTPTCNISSALALLMRKNSLSQHFFIQKPNTCHETVEFTSQSRQNTKNNSWATMPLASAFRPTCNLSSALAPLGRKNSLSQHFFIQKSKTCHETVDWIYEPSGAKQPKTTPKMETVATMPHSCKCLHAHMQHFFSPSSANEEKFAESAFFHTKIKNLSWNHWIYEPMGAKHKKLLVGNNAPGKCLHAHMQHFFSPSPAMEKKFAESAFFHTKIKNLSWNRWIYEPMGGGGGKHQKLLLGNNAPRKCLHAHMQHFFSPSSANEEKFAESAFFHTKTKHLSWNRWIYEPIEAKHQKQLLGNNAPGKCLQAHMQPFFSTSPAREKKFAESAFFHTKIKNLSRNHWIYEPMGKTPKTTPGQQCHTQVPSRPHATFLQP